LNAEEAKDAKDDRISLRPSRLPSRSSLNRCRAKAGPLRSTALVTQTRA